eukprot:COSAG02_NODE_81_length_39811_cov_51.728898_27_plen_812_part_00
MEERAGGSVVAAAASSSAADQAEVVRQLKQQVVAAAARTDHVKGLMRAEGHDPEALLLAGPSFRGPASPPPAPAEAGRQTEPRYNLSPPSEALDSHREASARGGSAEAAPAPESQPARPQPEPTSPRTPQQLPAPGSPSSVGSPAAVAYPQTRDLTPDKYEANRAAQEPERPQPEPEPELLRLSPTASLRVKSPPSRATRKSPEPKVLRAIQAEAYHCDHAGCGFSGTHDEVTAHKLTCMLYGCDHKCGFSGSFDEVARHKSTCAANPSLATDDELKELQNTEERLLLLEGLVVLAKTQQADLTEDHDPLEATEDHDPLEEARLRTRWPRGGCGGPMVPEPEPEPEPVEPEPEPEQDGTSVERRYVKKDAVKARRIAKEAGVSEEQLMQANIAIEQEDFHTAVTQLDAACKSVLRQGQESKAKKAALVARKKAKKAGVSDELLREVSVLIDQEDFAAAVPLLLGLLAGQRNAPADQHSDSQATEPPVEAASEGLPPAAAPTPSVSSAAARDIEPPVESVPEGLPPGAAPASAASAAAARPITRESDTDDKSSGMEEFEEIFTPEYHDHLAQTMSADDVVSYMKRVGLESWVAHFTNHLPSNMKSISALRRTSDKDIEHMSKAAGFRPQEHTGNQARVKRSLRKQPLPQELAESTVDDTEAEQGSTGSHIGTETRAEKLRRERDERASAEISKFLNANGLTQYQELFSGFKNVRQLSQMTRAATVATAAKRHAKTLTRAQHEQIAQAVKGGLAKANSRGAPSTPKRRPLEQQPRSETLGPEPTATGRDVTTQDPEPDPDGHAPRGDVGQDSP